MSNPSELSGALGFLFRELTEGASTTEAYMLNRGDPGLMHSLDGLSADAASAVPAGGGSSVAAHVDHLRYGLELLNRWSRGEDPFETADYAASWRRVTVTEDEWRRLREDLKREIAAWQRVLDTPRELGGIELKGVVSSLAHLAYHVGAIRQIAASARGPRAND